jgi:hypothetical protein
MDDVWISMQRSKRNVFGSGRAGKRQRTKKKPLRVGIAYTGWEKQGIGRYITRDKVAYASFENAKQFVAGYEALLSQSYDMFSVEKRILGGDGALWIRSTADELDVILQLDPYHRNRAVMRSVSNSGTRRAIFAAFKAGDADEAIHLVLTELKQATDENAKGKLMELAKYLSENYASLLTWQERGIELPPAPAGVSYRRLGAQEANNCNLITLRMKNRKGSWSVRGATNMAKILCYRQTIGLDTILTYRKPGEATRTPLRTVTQSAAETPEAEGKKYAGGWLQAPMPYDNVALTGGRDAIRNLLRLRTL